MSEAPDRIWAFPIKDWFRGGCSTHKIIERKYARDVEYIRADIHEARVKELELPADDTRSYDKGYTQGYSEGWDDGEIMVGVHLDMALSRIKELEAQLVAHNPEIKGIRALQGVTYVSVSDKNGRMDDDLFELVEAQNRIAEVNVGETMIDRIPDVDWTDQAVADWEITVGKLKENET